MKIDIRHLREPIHCTSASSVDTKMHFGLSFDGVHALFELKKDVNWWDAVEVPLQADSAQVLSPKVQAISNDQMVLIDKGQKSLLVNLVLAEPGALQSALNTVDPADVRHIVAHIPNNNTAIDSKQAQLNAESLSRFALRASTFGHISFEIRGAFTAEIVERIDARLPTHIALSGTQQLQSSLSALSTWIEKHANESRLCCLKIDTSAAFDPQTRSHTLRDSARLAALRILRQSIVCKASSFQHNITLRRFCSQELETQKTIGEALVMLVEATPRDGPSLILEECNVRLADAIALEAASEKQEVAVFIHKNDGKTHTRTADVRALECRYTHQNRKHPRQCKDDELYYTHHDITADEHAWAAVRSLYLHERSAPQSASDESGA